MREDILEQPHSDFSQLITGKQKIPTPLCWRCKHASVLLACNEFTFDVELICTVFSLFLVHLVHVVHVSSD